MVLTRYANLLLDRLRCRKGTSGRARGHNTVYTHPARQGHVVMCLAWSISTHLQAVDHPPTGLARFTRTASNDARADLTKG